MNILDFMEEVQVSDENLCNPAEVLFSLRKQTFHDFCALEVSRGGIDPAYELYTTQGQNNARQLFARMMEEMFESDEADSEPHRLEELIDALNFGLAIVFLGDWYDDLSFEAREIFLYNINLYARYPTLGSSTFPEQLYLLGQKFSPFLARLRNRTWQHGAQQPYFGGNKELIEAMTTLVNVVRGEFSSTKKFLEYYIAKDKVLQYRIRSKY